MALKLKYYYRVDSNGLPVPGSNVALTKIPRGTHYIEFTPAAMAQPCCPSGPVLPTTTGKAWRYYVRLDDNNLPISKTLIKAKNAPGEYHFQEVVGTAYLCCPIVITESYSTSASPFVHNAPAGVIFTPLSGVITGAFSTLTVAANGLSFSVVQTNSANTHTDTFVLGYKQNGIVNNYHLTIVYTHP